MNHGDVLVIGGTSDARAICQQLDAAGVRYTLSVATPTGERLAGDIVARPITVGDRVWIGGNTTILGGVHIGDEAVIGAGSVVTRDIPPKVVAVGNPCRVLRPITEKDRLRR